MHLTSFSSQNNSVTQEQLLSQFYMWKLRVREVRLCTQASELGFEPEQPDSRA